MSGVRKPGSRRDRMHRLERAWVAFWGFATFVLVLVDLIQGHQL